MANDRLIELAEAVGRIEGKLDEALISDRERLTKIENSLNRQWWMSYVITPFLLIAREGVRKLGVHV